MAETYVVVASDITALAGKFDTFKGDVDTAIGKLGDINLVAGDFADADTLETAVKARTGQLKTNLQGLADALGTISDNLNTIASTYITTEDLNGMTAEDLDDLIDALDTDLPGFQD